MKNLIDELAQTKTTAQIIDYYKRNGLDIIYDMQHCVLGLRLAIEQVLSKSTITIRHELPDRPELVDADIIESMKGDN